MWHTPVGDRQLAGHEAELVREALGLLVDQVSFLVEIQCEDPSDRWARGPGLFDGLTATQQMTLLYEVARHLLGETPAPLPLTAVTESAIGAIFDQVRTGVEMELYDQQRDVSLHDPYPELPTWRELVLAAYEEALSEDEREELLAEGFSFPAAEDTDAEQWDDLIESLLDRILWDRDYEMAALLLDADPVKTGRTKHVLGIEDDYYSEAAPDARDHDIEPLLDKIRAITHVKPR